MYEKIESCSKDKIGEINICNNKKTFNFYNVDYEYLSPYDFDNYFDKKMSFNRFTNNITLLMNYNIETQEIIHCRKFYGKYLIKDTKLNNFFNKEEYNNFINMLIKIKRLEYLSDYIVIEKFEATYILYLNNIIDTARKNKKKYINENF
tara:strand:+ start:243 stop:689 length:447 start_codon:yes stop_codon:yes gene_type:complete